MKNRLLLVIMLLIAVSSVFSNNQTVLNNNPYLVIANGANYVIDNPNTNAITTLGTGGNIISEGENNVVKWNVGSAMGVYNLPFTTTSLVKIPMAINITSAGLGNGYLELSTYQTTTDMNTPYPSGVTNMNLPSTSDGSLFVVDRFWNIAANSYTTKPGVTLTLNYNDAPNELGGSNAIVEANLVAQRYNSNLNDWQANNTFGIVDFSNNNVNNIVVSPSDFYANWILVDKSSPLPVSIVDFDLVCNNNNIKLKWSTVSEINNDYFVIEKSDDGVNFKEITRLRGADNSNLLQKYETLDSINNDKVSYYRLKQVDYNGNYEYFKSKATSCIPKNNFTVYPNPTTDNVAINFSNPLRTNATIYLYNSIGDLVFTKIIRKNLLQDGIDFSLFESGVYALQVLIDNQLEVIKIIKK